MAQSAGGVSINLTLNTASYSKGMTQAQREMNKFVSGTKTGMHSTVTSVQAAGGAIRELNGNFANNTRAVERFITMIPGVGKALQMAFPLIGGIAFGAMIVDMGAKVVAFIDKANKMPAAIKQGFETLHLSAMASNDALKLTDDLLQNHIDKLQGKPQNNLAIQLDEARIKADDLAKSLENDSAKVKALLSENKLSGLAGLLTGKAGTSTVSGSVQFGLNEIQHLAYLNRQAVGTPGAAQAAQNLADKQGYYQKWATSQLFTRNHPEYATNDDQDMAGDQTANKNILTGFLDVLNDQQSMQVERNRNAKLVPAEKVAQEQSDAAKKAAEARKKAAEERLKSWEVDAELFKQWQAYSADTAKALSEYTLDQFKTGGVSTEDSKSLTQSGKDSAARITAMRTQIDLNKQNADTLAESTLQMAVATGQMTKLDAARAMAALHQQQHAEAMQKLKDQGASIAASPEYNGHEEARQAALIDNQNRQSALDVSGTLQAAQDNQTINPAASSGAVGFTDALNDFVNATRDAAGQMRQITDSTLNTLNEQFVRGISGQRTDFGNAGASIFRSVAGTGIQKAEGSILGAFGFGGGGKLGTQANPMYVKMVQGASGLVNSAGSFLGKLFSGGSQGPGQAGLSSALSASAAGGDIAPIASDLTTMIPFLASGGPINGPAIVGEQGPELFNPGTPGTIIPNHQLSSAFSSGGDTHNWNIDARGSTDPAQTQAAVQRGIAMAAPHLTANAVKATKDDKRRVPTSRH